MPNYVAPLSPEEFAQRFADLHPAIAANPYISFFTVATESGTLTFTWTGDDGKSFVEKANITVA